MDNLNNIPAMSAQQVKEATKKLIKESRDLVFENAGRPKIHPVLDVSGRPILTSDGHVIVPPTPKLSEPVAAPMTEDEKKAVKRVETEKQLEKVISKHSLPELVSLSVGLPGRVRNLYRRIDKMLKGGQGYLELLEEIRPVVSKYLIQRMNVGLYSVILIRRELEKHVDADKFKRISDIPAEAMTPALIELLDRLKKIATSSEEADALMLLRAEYFLIGLTIDFCRAVSSLTYPPHVSMEALYLLLEIGNDKAATRNQRIATATKRLQSLGAELP